MENVLKTKGAPEGRQSQIVRRLLVLGLLPLLMIVLCIVLGIVEHKFLRGANLINVLRNASFLMLIALKWHEMKV